MQFSTKDADHDGIVKNCALSYLGAWWYNDCLHSNLNGFYFYGYHSSQADGINWLDWKGFHYSMKKATMKIKGI
jgi:hypothetical protein